MLNIFLQPLHLWKCFRTSFKKTLLMFVFTSALYSGLNQTTFLFLFREGFSWILSNFRFLLKPLIFSAFSYIGFGLFISSSWTDNDERCVFTIVGSCSKMFGGWFELAFTGHLQWHLPLRTRALTYNKVDDEKPFI